MPTRMRMRGTYTGRPLSALRRNKAQERRGFGSIG